MKTATLEAAKIHALDEFPKEACGIVVVKKGKEWYVPCKNIASTPSEHFIISPHDLAEAEDSGKITCYVHSHPNEGARPSQADLVQCENNGLPWTIIAVHQDAGEEAPRIADVFNFKPTGYEADLIGREFNYGVLDCWTLVQDWYFRELGIVLPDGSHTDGWWDKGQDLYMNRFKKWGFEEVSVDDIQRGDVIFMQIKSPVANHAAVYLGDMKILHHLYGRLSSRDVYGGYWQEVTRKIVRYKGVGDGI